MKKISSIISILLVFTSVSFSQHCEPIYETYINKIEFIKSTKSTGELNLSLNYVKVGGPVKEAYQIFIFLYNKDKEEKIKNILNKNTDSHLHKNSDSLMKMIHAETWVLKTTVINRQLGGYGSNYSFDLKIKEEELYKKILKNFKINPSKLLEENFKILVIIPFLESSYSNLNGLPKYKHECNYSNRDFLNATILPFTLKFAKYYEKKDILLIIENQN